MKPLCIYHGNCADGFGAAWVVHRALGSDVEFFAATYQRDPPDVSGRHVIMVDFSYKRQVLEEMAIHALSILILDHHKTAAADMEGIERPDGLWDGHVKGCFKADPLQMIFPPYIRAIFDMERSGAMITWNYFFPDEDAPKLIQHIQDRDLWKFELEGTREIQAALFSFPYDFDVWDELVDNSDGLFAQGEAIERKHFKDIAELLPVTQSRMIIAGHNVPVANLPYIHSSDAGHQMAIGEPFAACYMDGPDGRTYRLRSSDDGIDVSDIAKLFGGGGHARAAGFFIKSTSSEIEELKP